MKGNGCIVISDEEMLEALTYWFTQKTWTERELGQFVAVDLRRCEHHKRPHWKVSFVGEAVKPAMSELLEAARKMPSKIEAIKYIRAATGAGLKEAKEAVDEVWPPRNAS